MADRSCVFTDEATLEVADRVPLFASLPRARVDERHAAAGAEPLRAVEGRVAAGAAERTRHRYSTTSSAAETSPLTIRHARTSGSWPATPTIT